jgi:hypothetical protein
MKSYKLQRLEREMARQTPERIPAPETSGGIGAAIEQLIADEVASRVTDATEKQTNKRLDRLFNKPKPYTDYRQLPPTPRAPTPRKAQEIQVQHDELGRICAATLGDQRYIVQRNELGQMVRLIPEDIAPPQPCVPPPALAAAREYDPGKPRT